MFDPFARIPEDSFCSSDVPVMCDDEAEATCGGLDASSRSSPTSPLLPSNTVQSPPPQSTPAPPLYPPAKVRRHKSKSRRLKLYGVEEKIDIIDYAKVIGNRAAGREFNVAESSIREWRKNEFRLRQQMTTAGSMGTTCGMLRFEESNVEVVHELDRALVGYVTEYVSPSEHKRSAVDWFMIRQRAEELWRELERNSDSASLPSSVDGSVITMGWVSRFMHRNADVLPRIAPPPSAPTAAVDSSVNGARVRPLEKNGVSSLSPSQQERHRRKCLVPKRAVNPTLITASSKPPTDAADDAQPPKKKRRKSRVLPTSVDPKLSNHQPLTPSTSSSAKTNSQQRLSMCDNDSISFTDYSHPVSHLASHLSAPKAHDAERTPDPMRSSAAAMLGSQLHQLGQALLNFNTASLPNIVNQPGQNLTSSQQQVSTNAGGGLLSPADAIAMWLMKNC